VQKFKEPKNVKIWTYLFGFGREQVKGPLAEVQHSFANREDTRRMLLSIKKFAEPDLEDDVFEDSFIGVWNKMERVFEEAKSLEPNAQPVQPNPDAERELTLQEILRAQIDLQSKVDSVLASQAADSRRILRLIGARHEGLRIPTRNLTREQRQVWEQFILQFACNAFNKEREKSKGADKRSRESLPRNLDCFATDSPPDDDVPFHDAPPDDDVPFHDAPPADDVPF
jgi:hypothetical protein